MISKVYYEIIYCTPWFTKN